MRLESLESRKLLTLNLTPQEQLMIELVNRSRADPAEEAERVKEFFITQDDLTDFGLNTEVESDETISADPKQPLAPHQALIDAAGLHADDMLRRNYFAHDTPEGKSPSDRAIDAGYPRGAGENIAWSGNPSGINRNIEVTQRHYGLYHSVGHRINMMRTNWREIGAGVRYGTYTQGFTHYDSIMVGTLFGDQGGNHFITGVAMSDLVVRNSFYDIGEGLGDITITAVQDGTGETFTETTGTSGGYGMSVPNGTYTLTAQGGLLGTRTIVTSGVHVDGQNVKVDFVPGQMPTRSISGGVFEDTNSDGERSSSEDVLRDQTVFLDMNNNGKLDRSEPRTTTNSLGAFIFENLVPGDYSVAVDVPSDWEQVFPPENYEVSISPPPNTNLVGALFGLKSLNQPPVARDDATDARAGETVTIGVVGNDFDVDGSLDTSTVVIQSSPNGGTVTVDNAGVVHYSAHQDFTGNDSFTYIVNDNLGRSSNVGTVRVRVAEAFPWQNPIEPLDVNNDGHIVPQDVLVLFNQINNDMVGSLNGRVRDATSNYVDVNGDNFLTSIDALLIIQYLNRLSLFPSGSGEPPAQVEAQIPATHAERFFATFELDDDETDETHW